MYSQFDFLFIMAEFITKFPGVTFHYILVPGDSAATSATPTTPTSVTIAFDEGAEKGVIKIGFGYSIINYTIFDSNVADFNINPNPPDAAPTNTLNSKLWFIFKTNDNSKVSDFFSNKDVFEKLNGYFVGTVEPTEEKKKIEEAIPAVGTAIPAVGTAITTADTAQLKIGGSSKTTRRHRNSSSNKKTLSKTKTLKNHS